jgi:hypothetical protein
MQAHYLNVPGTEWEYKEVDQQTGRQVRKIYEVPVLLDPKDPANFNYPGEIIVCDGNSPQRLDIIFAGPPTPDMEPIDDEAKEISSKLVSAWQHPIDSLPGQGDYSSQVLERLEAQMTLLMKGQKPVANTVIEPTAFEALQQQVQALMEQNAALLEKLEEPKSRRL